MTLNTQINVRIFLSSLVILIIGCTITIWHAKNAIRDEIDSSVNMTTHIITCGLAQKSPNDAAWLNCFNSLKETRHLKIELLKPSGEVINLVKKDHQISRNQLSPQWFADLIGSRQAKTEKQLTTSIGEQFSLLIQADPLDETEEVWEESLGFFGTILLLTQLTFLSVYLALNKSIKSINSIVDALRLIETGNYRLKLPEFETTEYNSIAKAINHMIGELEKAQQENRALTQHSLEILETERKQLAQELHDELGQSLTAIKIMAITANRKESEIKPMTEAIAEICDNLIAVVRTLMHQLHPLVLSELGLKAALEDLITRWTGKQPALKISLDCPDALDLAEQKISIQVFRVIQECLTNVVRHADASKVTITLAIIEGAKNQISLSVKDNGKGCQAGQLKNGFGLLGMKERIQSLGGTLTIRTHPQQGMEISALIPYTQ
ncbi:MAG: histidine kinase [Methylococcaceae bacterium]|nr:histidine kinase [Methylococcaceae bacterium]